MQYTPWGYIIPAAGENMEMNHDTRLDPEENSNHRKKERTQEERKALIHRLNRIEGQIRGIRNMVEQDAYCPDILTQVAAASAALSSFTRMLLGAHIRTCVAEDIRAGNDGRIEELVEMLQKLMK